MSLQTAVLIFVNYSVWIFCLCWLFFFIIFHFIFSVQFLSKIDHKDHVIFSDILFRRLWFFDSNSAVITACLQSTRAQTILFLGIVNHSRITTDKQTLFKIYEEKSFYETELYSQICKTRSCMDYSLSRIISRSNNKEVDRNIYDP